LPRFIGLLILIPLAAAIIAVIHYYFWIRLVRDTELSGLARHVATGGVIALAALIVATPTIGRMIPSLGRVLAWPGFIWMGGMFFLLVILLGLDVMQLLVLLGRKITGIACLGDGGRRIFMARLLAGAALVSMGGLVTAAIQATRGDVAVKRVEVILDKLPPSLDGTKIVQLSDLHIGGLLGRSFIEQVVAKTDGLNPDVIAIVGDLVDGTIAELRPALAPMTGLRARYGTYFVTGNHEYYSRSSATDWIAELERMGIRVLSNQRVRIGTEIAGFDLAGMPDHGAGRFRDQGAKEDPAATLAGHDPSKAVVLLAHQPKSIHEAVRLGVDLQLSGHTHGGQIWPWGALVRLQQPFVKGLHRIGQTQIYVSCGTGFWGPPMRLGAPAEITEIILRSTSVTN
jgi:predicted MPP superfamily phosphohydrolase